MMKRCFRCKEVKPLSEFYKHPRMADGHFNKCKSCSKSDSKGNRAANIDRYREYERGRSETKKQVEAQYRKSDAGKAAHAKACTRYAANFTERRAAHKAVSNAIRDGKLTPLPCQVCGIQEVEAHHPDYSRPLDVVWLCRHHHSQIHKES